MSEGEWIIGPAHIRALRRRRNDPEFWNATLIENLLDSHEHLREAHALADKMLGDCLDARRADMEARTHG